MGRTGLIVPLHRRSIFKINGDFSLLRPLLLYHGFLNTCIEEKAHHQICRQAVIRQRDTLGLRNKVAFFGVLYPEWHLGCDLAVKAVGLKNIIWL
ncbi:hypothetical protein [Desulfobacter postgatei]|uniref:hypothetical protein n=1 Tax=Desulfobacter postgatei TaxID=2293 RepID=UPI00259B2F2F|nr:hypothetical protein [uncultured Desulfobacter sp.]